MKHQEIVKLLREIDDYAKAGAGVPIRVWRCAGEVADAVEQMENEIEHLREERRWIPVGERLPEEGEQVLCASSIGNIYAQSVVVFYKNDLGVAVWEDDDGFIYRPTHWMPLPAPPNGGEVEE